MAPRTRNQRRRQASPTPEENDPQTSNATVGSTTSTQTNGGFETPQVHSDRILIARFRKETDGVRINAWLNLFELVTINSRDDQSRIMTLMRYVEGEALTWFGDEIAPHASFLSWPEVKRRMIARFGQIIVRPLIAAHKRFLQATENVQKYYEEKMDLMRQTTMTQLDMIASLTEGMPFQYHNHLIACGPNSVGEWLSKALQFETSMGKRRSNYRPIGDAAAGTASQDSKPFDKKKNKAN